MHLKASSEGIFPSLTQGLVPFLLSEHWVVTSVLSSHPSTRPSGQGMEEAMLPTVGLAEPLRMLSGHFLTV